MRIDVWSDVVCPWCYIGKRRLEAAIADRDDVEVVWRSFQLDPTTVASDEALTERLSRKYGVPHADAEAMQQRVTQVAAGEGLVYRLDMAHPEPTFDAHRLLHHAHTEGVQNELKEALLRGYFCEGARIGDRHVLADVAERIGLDAAKVTRVLHSDAYAEDVRADVAAAARLGVTGVPTFVIGPTDATPRGVSGAQPVETIRKLLAA